VITPLQKVHDRTVFDCGKDVLNNYLTIQVNQDIKRKLSACFVLSNNGVTIEGYYTLSSSSIPLSQFPENLQNKLPKSYVSIPTTLLGRLAIDKRFQGRGLGNILLMDALKRCYDISKEIASYAVIVDPLDREAKSFYEQYDFIQLPDSKRMILAMKTLKGLF
jgi:predicted GNAT family N-acyltransferase